MTSEPQPESVPTWVLQEVGRLHLHALALERELVRQAKEADDARDR